VQVLGAGLSLHTQVWFDGAPGEVIGATGTGALSVVTPPGAVGPADVTVISETEERTLFGGFYYVTAELLDGPTALIALSPTIGPTEGGIPVSIVAAGLTSVVDTKVYFGGTKANLAALDPVHGTVEVLLPPGEAGAVDVELTSKNGEDTLPGGFLYADGPKVVAVEPPTGTHQGGNTVEIVGSGLAGATSVRIGALLATNIKGVSDSKLTATAPPGSPGLADVTVTTPAGEGTAKGAYTYLTGEMKVLVTDPPQGSMAGGGEVRIHGTDFPAEVKVFFDTTQVPGPVVESAGTVRVIAPAWGQPASVEVRVVDAKTGAEAALPDGYTYFNPAASNGGTWGGPIEGTLNVTALDIWSQEGVEGAYVILWKDEETEYQGITDALGQITFSGPDLAGIQMVSAWKEGYSAASIVEFDAENATVLLFPDNPPASGGGGQSPFGQLATIQGNVKYNEKYLIPPPGKCGGTELDPIEGEKKEVWDYLCLPCEADHECGPEELGGECTPLVGGDTWCTTPCDTGADCPSGYACIATELGGADPRCIPISGQIRVRCETTTSDPYSTNPQPGVKATADLATGDFEIQSRPGDLAVVCVAELFDPEDESITPLAMGAASPVITEAGGTVTGVVVELDTALNRSVDVAVDYPPSKLSDLPNHRLRTLLYFADGELGFYEMDRSTFGPEQGLIQLDRMPAQLGASLSDARWLLMGGAYSLDSTWIQWFPPYSTAVMRDLPGLATSHLYAPTGTGKAWEDTEAPVNPIRAMWTAQSDFAVALGEAGGIYAHVGGSWTLQGTPIPTDWNAVWGVSAELAWAAGADGSIIQYNGAYWQKVAEVPFEPHAIAGLSADHVLVGGEGGQLWRFDGETWGPIASGTTEALRAMWASPGGDIVWIVGDNGTLIAHTLQGFQQFALSDAANLYAISGASADDVWVAGQFGALRHFDGSKWAKVASGTSLDLLGVWTGSDGRVHAVGERGTILEITAKGEVTDRSLPQSGARLMAVTGWGDQVRWIGGEDAVLFGPLLEVPQFASPLSEGYLQDDEIPWKAPAGAPADFNTIQVGQPWWKPLWHVVTDGDVHEVELPDTKNLTGQAKISGQGIYLELTRGRMQGFDIDNFDFITLLLREAYWDAWSVNFTTFSTFGSVPGN
jgi:hypothetical protein